MLMGAFLPARDCPQTFAANRAFANPDLWPEASRQACMAEMAPDIEANIRLVADLFSRLANAYASFESSTETYAALRGSAWRLAGAHSFFDDGRRFYEAAAAAVLDYDEALAAMAAALQGSGWAVAAAPGAFSRVIDGRVLSLTAEDPIGGMRVIDLNVGEHGDGASRGLFPGPGASVALRAPSPLAPVPILALTPQPSPMPVFFFGRLQVTGNGTFITRTSHEQDAGEGAALFGAVQDAVCAISPDLCRKAADPENHAGVWLAATNAGDEHEAFIASPAGYSACRAQIAWTGVAMPPGAHFSAGIARAPGHDGIAVRATVPDGFRAANWISADLLLSFVRSDLLPASNCWEDGTLAWNCPSRFCAAIHPEARFEMPSAAGKAAVCVRVLDGQCTVRPNGQP